jgi:hypothetical protein
MRKARMIRIDLAMTLARRQPKSRGRRHLAPIVLVAGQIWVKSTAWTVGRSLPVHPNEQTFSLLAVISQKGYERTLAPWLSSDRKN